MVVLGGGVYREQGVEVWFLWSVLLTHRAPECACVGEGVQCCVEAACARVCAPPRGPECLVGVYQAFLGAIARVGAGNSCPGAHNAPHCVTHRAAHTWRCGLKRYAVPHTCMYVCACVLVRVPVLQSVVVAILACGVLGFQLSHTTPRKPHHSTSLRTHPCVLTSTRTPAQARPGPLEAISKPLSDLTPTKNDSNRPSGQGKTKLFRIPPVLGGIKAGTRKLCVITGASSGLGREAARVLAAGDEFFVICAVRDVEKMKRVADEIVRGVV